MLIYTNGCSHSDDHPSIGETYVWTNQLMSGFTKSFNYYRDVSSLTLKELGILNDMDFLINEGKTAVGNDHIFHQTLESVSKLLEIGKKPDFVIIQWSSPNRREHMLLDGTSVFINVHDNVEYHLKYEPLGTKHTTHYIYSLQQFFIDHDIKYYFFNYMQFDYYMKELEIYKKIKMEKFVDFGLKDRTLFVGLIDLLKERKYTRDDQGHSNEIGNKFIANTILEKIKLDPLNKDFFINKI